MASTFNVQVFSIWRMSSQVQKLNLPISLAIIIYILYRAFTYGRRDAKLPPGPPTLPLIGNLMVFPKNRPHIQFTKWEKEYGDAFSLKVMNKTIIVINTPTLVKELIDKRYQSTSNRPKSIIADMITPHNMNIGTGRYANATWKALRKASAQLLSAESIRRHTWLQEAESAQLLWEFAHDPENWHEYLKRYTASVLLAMVYGKRAPTLASPDLADFLHVHPRFMNALEIGTMPPVDLFPILNLVPERWANWKRVVNHIRSLHETLYGRLLNSVKARMDSGSDNGAFLEHVLQHAQDYGLTTHEHQMNLGGTLLEGSDTSSATMQNAVLALVAFPHVQEKMREEIDRVVGSERMPTLDDMPNLPYTRAFIEENHRFRPVGPLGLPHEMSQDEVINSYLYPKGAVVFINIWGLLHDERYFDNPEEFLPERFLKHPLGIKEGIEDDPARRPNLQFGGGRRVCPGIHFARVSMEINITSLVWGFDFLPAIDPATKQELFPSLDNYTSGVTAVPIPVPIRIVPRSNHHKELIQRRFSAVAEVLAPYELESAEEDKKFNATYRDGV